MDLLPTESQEVSVFFEETLEEQLPSVSASQEESDFSEGIIDLPRSLSESESEESLKIKDIKPSSRRSEGGCKILKYQSVQEVQNSTNLGIVSKDSSKANKK